MSQRTDHRRVWTRRTGEALTIVPAFDFADAPYRVVLNCQRPAEETITRSNNSRLKPASFQTVNRIEEVTS